MNTKFRRFIVFLAIWINTTPLTVGRSAKTDSRIIGGLPAYDISVPYIASLVTYGFHGCGGSIINERTILTAAHCLVYTTPRLLKVHVGTKVTSIQDGELIRVQSVHPHAQWNMETMDYDIALVRLARPLRFSDAVQPIQLPEPSDKLADDDYVTIAGWGLTEQNGEPSQFLRYARVPVMNQAHCNVLMGGTITEHMVCAGFDFGGVDACQLDSGGPMVKDNKIFGIVSWGIGCALPEKPGIYTRVQAFLPWINQTLKTFNEHI